MTFSQQETKGVIIVTGCSGRIGSRITAKLSDQYIIVGLDLVPPKHSVPNMEYFPMDLTLDDSVTRGFHRIRELYGDKITSVIHLVSYYNIAGENPELYETLTVKGTERLLDALKGFQIEQFVYASTPLVHAPCEVGQTISEDSPVDPKWEYPQSQLKTEHLIKLKREKTPLVILRIADCYDEHCHSVPISNQIQRIFEGTISSRFYPGNVGHGSAYLHLSDLVDLIGQIVQRRHQLPEELVLLVGEDKTMSYEDLQRELSLLIRGKSMKTRGIPKSLAKSVATLQNILPLVPKSFVKPDLIEHLDDHYALDITRARTMLGWNPKHFLRNELQKIVASLRADPVSWYYTNGLRAPNWIKKRVYKSCCHEKS